MTMPICRDCGNNDAFIETSKCIDKVFYAGTYDVQEVKTLESVEMDYEPVYCWRCNSSNVDRDETVLTAGHILSRLADILYPMDGYRDDQWNGADVCDEVAALLRTFMPEAATRQPEREPLAEWEKELLGQEEPSPEGTFPSARPGLCGMPYYHARQQAICLREAGHTGWHAQNGLGDRS